MAEVSRHVGGLHGTPLGRHIGDGYNPVEQIAGRIVTGALARVWLWLWGWWLRSRCHRQGGCVQGRALDDGALCKDMIGTISRYADEDVCEVDEADELLPGCHDPRVLEVLGIPDAVRNHDRQV